MRLSLFRILYCLDNAKEVIDMTNKYIHIVLKNGKYFIYTLPDDSAIVEELLNSHSIKYYWVEEVN